MSALTGGKWCWSIDYERFNGHCATREQAISEARNAAIEEGWDETPAWRAQIGRVKPWNPYRTEVETLIEQAQEHAYDDVGDAAEYWLDRVTEEQKSDLCSDVNDVWSAWLKRHSLEPTFYEVTDVEEVEL